MNRRFRPDGVELFDHAFGTTELGEALVDDRDPAAVDGAQRTCDSGFSLSRA